MYIQIISDVLVPRSTALYERGVDKVAVVEYTSKTIASMLAAFRRNRIRTLKNNHTRETDAAVMYVFIQLPRKADPA